MRGADRESQAARRCRGRSVKLVQREATSEARIEIETDRGRAPVGGGPQSRSLQLGNFRIQNPRVPILSRVE